MLELGPYALSAVQVTLLIAVGLLVGMAKTGVQGAGMIAVPILALIFGARESTGVLLPILVFADFFGVYYFHQHANWRLLRRLLPYAIVGVILGTIIGEVISDLIFTQVMVVTIALCVVIMVWRELSKELAVPSSSWFGAGFGVAGGFTTMVGNLAGPVMALYLLAMRLPKNELIGTGAWFFLVVNLIKVPFHIWVWETIDTNTVLLDLCLLPAIAIGAVIGVKIVALIPEKTYRWFVIIVVALAALPMMF